MFQTRVEIPHSELKISYESQIMTLGSCFAENIGRNLKELYFGVDINPFGVLYNPVSISNSIRLMLEKELFTETDIFEHRGLWQSFSHSSLFSDTSIEKTLNNINTRFEKAVNTFEKADFLLITFGTAWVFEDQKSGRVVSNCHKLPAKHFTRRRLTVEEIVADYSELINQFPAKEFIMSVSPIRHRKDGAHENNISKSTLILAIDELQKQFKNVRYFPAYEIQMDELRDYRFYASDMLHPSEVAIDYIWQRFSETFFDDTTVDTKKELEQLRCDLSHRPLFPESEEFHKFQQQTTKRKADLIKKYPFLAIRMD